MLHNPLKEALDELDSALSLKKLSLEIVICGAFAIQLLGFNRGLQTLDVDTITKISNPDVLDLIEEIGLRKGLSSNWLNDQASSVIAPKGLLKRALKIDDWTSINAFVIDRTDLIKMKASAFSIRREETSKDWDDLILLSPTKEEMAAAIEFLTNSNFPPKNASKADLKNFKETIDDLLSIV